MKKIPGLLVIATGLLAGCTLTPEQQAGMRAFASGMQSAGQNVQQQTNQQTNAVNQRQNQSTSCTTRFVGNTAYTDCQ